ncbi:MAG TPA: DICT sensory domain-containing protein [Pyrinomonadaceae bacterium]|nr:DICT sensory domain-containing protein [Pyrinomonadaceae bacterium]
MKSFSVFEYALHHSGTRIDDLGEVASLARKEFIERESFIFRTTIASVEYGCLMIENDLLLRTNRCGRVYAGFEKFSQLQPIIDRYLRIADVSESVYLFGQDDWKPPRHPNIRVIPLSPDFQLARELFVITHSPSLTTAFVALDEGGADTCMPEQIRFWAIKTSNRSMVNRLVQAVDGVIDWTLAA